jgi:outer membrane protein OmpA-like peptidoglycan-associated protein
LDVTSLSAAQKSHLALLARTVKNERFPGLSIIGYSDPLSTGAAASELGLARAQAVASYLHQRLVAIGDGTVTIGVRAGGVLDKKPYSSDRVAVLSS